MSAPGRAKATAPRPSSWPPRATKATRSASASSDRSSARRRPLLHGEPVLRSAPHPRRTVAHHRQRSRLDGPGHGAGRPRAAGTLRERYPEVAVAGYSMGGHMGAITAAVSPFPLACAALAASSASSVYTRGLLSWSVDFTGLGGGATQRAAARDACSICSPRLTSPAFPPRAGRRRRHLGLQSETGTSLRSETERLHRHWPGSTLR